MSATAGEVLHQSLLKQLLKIILSASHHHQFLCEFEAEEPSKFFLFFRKRCGAKACYLFVIQNSTSKLKLAERFSSVKKTRQQDQFASMVCLDVSLQSFVATKNLLGSAGESSQVGLLQHSKTAMGRHDAARCFMMVTKGLWLMMLLD